MCAEHSGNHNSRGFTYLREVHGLEPGSEAADKFLDAVSKMIEAKTSVSCTKRTAENIICKCFRNQVNSDNQFKDMVFQSFYVYEPCGNGIRVHSQNGNRYEVDGPLVTSWKWKGYMKSTQQIASEVGHILPRQHYNFMIPPGFEIPLLEPFTSHSAHLY
jgi:hypothetical protein